MNRIIFITLIIGLLISGCKSVDEKTAEELHKHEGNETVTVWTDNYELFLEYSFESCDKPIEMLIHLTSMKDFLPYQNELKLIVDSGNFSKSIDTVFMHEPGIYETEILLPKEGEYKMSFILNEGISETIVVPEIHIHGEHEYESGEIHEEENHTGNEGITFLKEQQWNTEFATVPAIEKELSHSVQATGEIISKLDADVIVSAPFTGMIMPDHNLHLPLVGDYVKKGGTLAVITPSAQGDSEQNFAARYIERESQLKLSKIELDRAERLFEKDAIPQKDLQTAVAKYDEAKANFGSLNAFIEKYQVKDENGAEHPDIDFILKAPINGFIEEIYFQPGEEVETGKAVLRLIDNSYLWIKINVPVSEIMEVNKPERISFKVHGMDKEIQVNSTNGRLVSLGNLVSSESRTVPVIFELKNDQSLLKIGMFADVKLYTGKPVQCIIVPEEALIEDEGVYYVFVQTSGEKFERRNVRIGITDSGFVQIISGVNENERVVTKGSYQVKLASQVTGLPEHGHVH